jgi:UDP-glucose 4-epimerase
MFARKMTPERDMINKKVLITGGLGFIGSNLAIRLIEMGATVTLVDSLIPEYGGNLFNIAPVEGVVRINISDVRDAHSMRCLIQGHDYLFNLAGQTSHMDSMRDPYTDLEINAKAQLFILEACRRSNPDVRIVYAGTRQIYGKPVKLPADESHPVHPTDVNGVNKASGEMYHQLYHEVYGLRTTSLRLTNTYGPRQLVKHPRQGFAGWFIRQAVLGEEIQVFGDGQQKRDFNYIDDVVEAFLLAAVSPDAEGKKYNLGASPAYTLLEFVEILLKEAGGGGGFRIVAFPDERKRIDIGNFYNDYGKIKSELGWEPRVDLREGLAKSVDYYKNHIQHYVE